MGLARAAARRARRHSMPRIEEDENMFSIRTSVIATVALMAVLAIALAGSVGTASAQSSTPLKLQSGDSALPMESKAALGADTHRETLAQEYFHLDWNASPGRPGMSRIVGYVYNDYGQAAEDIELKIIGLDSAGQPLNTMFRHMSDTVPSRGRGYFDLQVPVSESYKIDVESFEFTMGHGSN
jgi:hypothetical protein